MSRFEYVMTLASFVIAFGVSRLLGGWARQYALRHRIPIDPLQVVVSALLLVALLQNVWAFWFAREIIWTFGVFLLMLVSQLALVGAATLIHPPDSYASSIRDYYFEVRRAVFGLCAVWIVVGGILDDMFINSLPGNLPLAVMFAFRVAGLCIFLFFGLVRPPHPSLGRYSSIGPDSGWLGDHSE